MGPILLFVSNFPFFMLDFLYPIGPTQAPSISQSHAINMLGTNDKSMLLTFYIPILFSPVIRNRRGISHNSNLCCSLFNFCKSTSFVYDFCGINCAVLIYYLKIVVFFFKKKRKDGQTIPFHIFTCTFLFIYWI